MSSHHKERPYQEELEKLTAEGNLRSLRHYPPESHWLNVSSNDYLALSCRNDRHCPASSVGSCSSRLLTGNHQGYIKLEEWLQEQYNSEAALCFNSGYHANMGILPALTSPHDLILADKLVHASMIDGIRLSAAKTIRFPHNDWQFAERLLASERSKYRQVFIVIESIYSMDGDKAPLRYFAELRNRFDCFLYVDEAHAIGTNGNLGLGLCEEVGIMGNTDLLMGTFGKAIASEGAFVCCSNTIKQYLVNRCRPLIFSTAQPQSVVESSLAHFQLAVTLTHERAHLVALSERLREGIRQLGFRTAGDSHIVPLITGDSHAALALADFLKANGVLALPIRRPTVPANEERIRFSLTAALTVQQIDKIISLCKQFSEKE